MNPTPALGLRPRFSALGASVRTSQLEFLATPMRQTWSWTIYFKCMYAPRLPDTTLPLVSTTNTTMRVDKTVDKCTYSYN